MILIRHAEPQAGGPDPGLSTAGQARAQELVHALGDSGVTVIVTSHLTRTQQTAAPLAAHLGLTPHVVTATDVAAATALAASAGSGVALVVGHSNTVPAVIASLGAGTMPNLPEDEFDNLFVVHCETVTRLRYGG